MNAGSLFSGAGLLDLGLSLAGWNHAFLCESDPWRRELLRTRFPGVPVYEDVRDVDGSAPRVDLLAGGFPCRGASSAGKQEGFDHPQTALWREFARVIRDLRPRLVLIENVANLLSVARTPSEPAGTAWGEVVGSLAEIGYVGVWDCLPSAAFGAPHLRDRVFCVACDSDRMAGTEAESGRGRLGAVAQPRSVQRTERPTGLAAPHPPRNVEGREPAQGGTDRERAGAGADDVADAGRERGELRRGPGEVAGAGRQAQERERSRDASGGGGEDAADAHDKGRDQRPERDGPTEEAGVQLHPGNEPERRGVRVEWGSYGPAVHRWEAIRGPAPEPLVRRLDDGDRDVQRLRARVDRSRLSALGDGVQVQAGHYLGERLMEVRDRTGDPLPW